MSEQLWSASPALRTWTLPPAGQPFKTERCDILPELTLAYESWGTLNADRDNAILIFHALTGDSHAASHPDLPRDHPGWWESIVGPGCVIDTNRFYVLCVNAPGSCYGSTGPSSTGQDGHRYNLRFPALTVRDLVRAQLLLVKHLGISRIVAAIGGSLGGMEALECALLAPDIVEQAIVIAASGRFHAQGIALNEIQRRAIMLDPAWNNGEYCTTRPPGNGVALARMLGMVSYQCDVQMEDRFGRNPARYNAWPEFQNRYDIEGYLHYQGDKLAARFDANSYLYLSRAMDSHDISDGRGDLTRAAATIEAECLFVGISSDILFPPSYVQGTASLIRESGGRAKYVEMESNAGHDAFLKDFDSLGKCIRPALSQRADRSSHASGRRQESTVAD